MTVLSPFQEQWDLFHDELRLELRLRNAWLQAWRDFGVRLEGGWRFDNEEPQHAAHVLLSLRCEACDRGCVTQVHSVNSLWREFQAAYCVNTKLSGGRLRSVLSLSERRALTRGELCLYNPGSSKSGRAPWSVCDDVEPLLRVAPPEVLALYDLARLEATSRP